MNTFTNKHSILALMLLLFTQGVYAQKEGYNWYFGTRAQMTWNITQDIVVAGKTLTGMPTPIPLVGTMNPENTAGVCCISDADGKGLFSSNGVTVYRVPNWQIMSNGQNLLGHNSSPQSGIVVPHPGQPDKYYLFSIGRNFHNRLAYSVVDMSANFGSGAVLNDEKSILLTGYKGVVGESVAAVRHSNGVDFWVIAPGKGPGENSVLNVWKVTTAGIDPVCFASYPLATEASATASTNGYLRFSVDGKRFTWGENTGNYSDNSNILHLGEFNPSDGTFPTIKSLNIGFPVYALEFSPSTEILYANTIGSDKIHIYKFAELLAASNPPVGLTTRIMSTGITGSNNSGALQLGPDGRIYGARIGNSSLNVIDEPDDFDNATIHNVWGLIERNAAVGLPNFMGHYFAPTPNEGVIGANQTICNNTAPALLTSIREGECDTETITYLWEQSTDSATWATATGTNNLTTYQPPVLTATTYYRRSETSPSCGTVYSNVVKITVGLAFSAGTISNTSTSISSGATPNAFTSTPASGGVGVTTYQWQSSPNNSTWTNIAGATSATYAPGPLTATTYFRRAATNTCGTVHTTSVLITVSGAADMINTSGSSTSICNGEVAALSASLTTPGSVISPVYRWYSAATGGSPLHTGATYSPMPTTTTTYYVSVSGTSQAESPRKAVVVTVRPVATPDMIKITQ